MRIRVRYLAALREQRGESLETLDTAAPTAGALYEELRARHGLAFPPEHLRAAVNDAFVPWLQPLREGDEVMFLPPVSGG